MQELPQPLELQLTGVKKSSKILVGISGGADSVFLARSLWELGYSIELAHMNYQLRAAESEEDQIFVEELGNELSVEVHVNKLNLKEEKKNTTKGTQELARDLRYTWFKNVLVERNLDFLAVGHHSTDQVETVLGHLIRGTGIWGMAGMQVYNNEIIRPLLHWPAARIREACERKNWPFRRDSSNDSLDYTRNKIRHLVLPKLEEVRADALEQVAKSVSQIQEHTATYSELLRIFLDQVRIKTEKEERLDRSALNTFSHPHILVHHWLHVHGFSYDQCVNITRPTIQTGATFVSHSSRAKLYVHAHELSLELEPKKDSFNELITTCGRYTIPNGELRVDIFHGIPERSTRMVYLPWKNASFSFGLRNWKHGDRIQALGMKGSKLVSDVLIDQKIPLQRKSDVLVLEQGENIIWILGLKSSEHIRHNFEDGTYLRFRILS